MALSEQVAGAKPLAVLCDGQQLALYRNDAGQVFALEDRCPHRRVLLSPGVVKPGGLQCPYHGWTFDGASGKCTDIPNLRRDEKIPAAAVRAYPVAEQNGFIHVFTGAGQAPERLPASGYGPQGREYTGTAVAGIAIDEYLDVMLDGPECLMAFPGVLITDFFLGEPRREGAHLVLDRGAMWKGRGPGPAFVSDHSLLVRTRVPLAGGDIAIELLDAAEQALVTVQVAATANRRGTTSLAWRGFAHARANTGPRGWRLRRFAGMPPFTLFAAIEGRAIAALEKAPSLARRGIIPISRHPDDHPCAAEEAFV